MYRLKLVICLVLLSSLSTTVTGHGQEPKPVRARPPHFPQWVVDLFSRDVQDYSSSPKATKATPAPDSGAMSSQPPKSAQAPPAKLAWSKLILTSALEDEIKSFKPLLAADIGSPRSFKITGYKKCRRDFSLLAMFFAVASDYDGPIRWKQQAASAREVFAQTASRCIQPADLLFEEAQQRAADLDTMLRNELLEVPMATLTPQWPKLVDRPSLMSRMERAQQQGLTVWTANEKNFSRMGDKIRHEAMILATLAEVLIQPGCESANDKEYVGHAKALQRGALDLLATVKDNNFEQAQTVVGNISKSCTACHATYR